MTLPLCAAPAAKQQRASRSHAVLLPPLAAHSHSNHAGVAGSGGSAKWQVQNVVGGGSLYGLSDARQLEALQRAGSCTDEEEGDPEDMVTEVCGPGQGRGCVAAWACILLCCEVL